MKKIITPIILLAAAAMLTACLDEPDCIRKTTNFVNLKFYDLDNNQPDTITIAALSVVGSDSILVSGQNVVSLRLPLRPDQNSTTFIFDSELGEDTLVFTYKINARLVSEECGIETIYSNLAYAQNDFDSINVVNKILIEDITEDVKIYN